MARIKRETKKKRRTVMHRAKGYYFAYTSMLKEQVQHSLQYQYRDRRNKKREIRSLWITRINAAARLNDISFSVHARPEGCRHRARPQGPGSDAYEDIESFNELAAIAKKALEA